jgi:hypothetical protein
MPLWLRRRTWSATWGACRRSGAPSESAQVSEYDRAPRDDQSRLKDAAPLVTASTTQAQRMSLPGSANAEALPLALHRSLPERRDQLAVGRERMRFGRKVEDRSGLA